VNTNASPSPASPWTVRASGIEPLPVGTYYAKFVGDEDFSHPEKGIEAKWKWTWEIASGPHKGKSATALTDQKLTPATHAGRLIGGMAGRPLQPGEDVQALVQGFVGKTWAITIQPGPKGGKPGVQSATPPPEM
jgi:hypothetical protein